MSLGKFLALGAFASVTLGFAGAAFAQVTSPLESDDADAMAIASFSYFTRIVGLDTSSPGAGAETLSRELKLEGNVAASYMQELKLVLAEESAVRTMNILAVCSRKDELRTPEAIASAIGKMQSDLQNWKVQKVEQLYSRLAPVDQVVLKTRLTAPGSFFFSIPVDLKEGAEQRLVSLCESPAR